MYLFLGQRNKIVKNKNVIRTDQQNVKLTIDISST